MTTIQLEHPTLSFGDCEKLCRYHQLSYFQPAGCWTFQGKLVIIYNWRRSIPLGYISLVDDIPLYTADDLINFIEKRKTDILKAREQTINAELLNQIEQL